jgi:hypothetical protein
MNDVTAAAADDSAAAAADTATAAADAGADSGVTQRKVSARKQTNKTAAAAPRKFMDYTVMAYYGDGSNRPVGSTNNFADTEAIKTVEIARAMNAGHGIPKFKIIERDYDETRDKEDHMIESEVS